MRLILYIVVGFLVTVGVGASVMHYMKEPYNEGFVQHPFITGVHVVLGGTYLFLAPLQFVKRIRTRAMGYHRWAGRFLASSGLLIGAAAFFMAVFIPFSGWPERIVNGFFAIFFVVAIVKGVLYARAHAVDLHREWMIRAFSLGLAIATMRLIFIPILIAIGEPTRQQTELFSIVSFTVGFVVHAAAAEWWIRYTRRASIVEPPASVPTEVPG